MLRSIPIIALLITLTACLGPAIECLPGECEAEESESGDGGETGAVESTDGNDSGDGDGDPVGEVFAEIRCVDTGLPDALCMGRPAGSVDAWVIAATEHQLDQYVAEGNAVDIDSWTDGCAAGEVPSTFMPEYRCLWLTEHETSACFAGDGKWWTQVDRCVEPGPDPAWPTSQCDGEAGAIGENPWTSVACHNVESGSCTATSGVDSMWIWPTCWVDQWPQVGP